MLTIRALKFSCRRLQNHELIGRKGQVFMIEAYGVFLLSPMIEKPIGNVAMFFKDIPSDASAGGR